MILKLGSLVRAVGQVKVNILTGTNVPVTLADSLVKVLLVPGLSLE